MNQQPFEEESLVQIEIEGAFDCHFCGEQVGKAIYLPNHSVLTWMCEKGHKSFIEKFRL